MQHSTQAGLNRLLCALTLCGSGTLPAAQDETAPEIVEGRISLELARHFAGGRTMYDGLPPDFPAFDVPQGLRVAGSNDFGGGRQVVVFYTSLPERQAQEALSAAFLARAGWRELEILTIGGAPVFIPLPEPTAGSADPAGYSPRELCNDAFGTLRFQLFPENGMLSLSRNPIDRRVPAPYCEQRQQRRMSGYGDTSILAGLLPRLELPAGGVAGGYGGGDRERRAEATLINPAYSLEALALHFASQFEE